MSRKPRRAGNGFGYEIELFYICVKDMDRAISFYESFFGQPVDTKDEIFSIFDFKGFRFCLFNTSKVNEEVVWGDNCLLSFEVSDMNKFIGKLNALGAKIVFPLTRIGDNWVLGLKTVKEII